MIRPNEMQSQVIDYAKNNNIRGICLILNGVGAGNTTALLLAAIFDKNNDCIILAQNPHFNGGLNEYACEVLIPYGFEVENERGNLIFRNGDKVIQIRNMQDDFVAHSLRRSTVSVFVDGWQNIPYLTMWQVLRNWRIYVVSTLDQTLVLDVNGCVDYGKSSNIAVFFDIPSGADCIKREYLDKSVHLITGYGVCDELDHKCPNYKVHIREASSPMLLGAWT